MISVYKLKPKFQQLLQPLLFKLHKSNITANQITMASIVFSFIIATMFWFASDFRILFLSLPIGLFIRMALNALDGMMAKTFNQISKKGEVLNEMGDVFSDLIIFLPLIKFFPQQTLLVVVFISLSIINEMAGLIGKVVSLERRYDGPMGKSDRAFLLGVFGIIAYFGINYTFMASYILGFINLLLLVSTFLRLSRGLKNKL